MQRDFVQLFSEKALVGESVLMAACKLNIYALMAIKSSDIRMFNPRQIL